jgi:hypothetical protein
MIARRDLRNQTSLDPYLVSEKPTKADVLFINVGLLNLYLPTDPVRRVFSSKVDDLVGVLRDLMTREDYALDSRLRDEAFMKDIVGSENEYMQVKRLAHRTGRIKEHGVINGAWIVA